MQNYTEQIKERVSISSIVSLKVALKTKGKGELLGLCPFHQEKTPSFTVSDQKGFYHCFGCGAHGDIFAFLMETEGDSYKEALEKLAIIAGVRLPNSWAESNQRNKQNDVLFSIFAKAAEFYKKHLYSSIGAIALNYLTKRGLHKNIIDQYGLGFAPENSNALVELINANFSKEDIQKSALFNSQGARQYDPLHGRIIFPIHDNKGRVLAFGGRILSEGQPKYLNSAENPLFEKGKLLYGLHLAKSTIYKQQEAIVTEGYMDVISLANAGVYNSVAPLGTALKISQLELLWQIIPQPAICMDSDVAGKNASARIAHEALPYIAPDKTLKFIQLTKGKDPDEIIIKYGLSEFNKCIDSAIPLVQMLVEISLQNSDLKTPEGKIKFQQILNQLADKIQDAHLKNEYKKYFKNAVYKLTHGYQKPAQKIHPSLSKESLPHASYELEIFNILLTSPSLLQDEEVMDELMRIEFSSIVLDRLRDFILINTDTSRVSSIFVKDDGQSREIKENVQRLIDSICSTAIKSPGETLSDIKKKLMRAFKLSSLSILKGQIKEAELLVQKEKDNISFERLMTLKSLEQQLKTELNVI